VTRPLFLFAGGAAVFGVLLLGAIQISSMAAYGDLAVPASLPASLRALGLSRVPVTGNPRIRAAALVHNGDVAGASTLLGALPDDAESEDLRGLLAARAGRNDEAIAHFIRAADGSRAQAMIDALAPSALPRALAYQRRLVAVLAGDPQALDTGGQAWLRLGQLQRAVGTIEPARRRSLYDEAQQSYLHALASAPNDATYLLGAANQAMLNTVTFGTDPAPAEAWLRRVVEVTPDSADGYAGLAQVTAMRGDCAAARVWRERWRSVRSAHDRDPVDEPELGPPLRRCVATTRE
jgi:tetratricopeptide (TPR) repeat protein